MTTKKRRRYPAEYQARMVDLVRSGKTPEELSPEHEASAQAIRNWVLAADRAEGRRNGWTREERKEVRELRRKLARVREERDILKKAAAWFAQEASSGSTDL